jgi:PII-like signaling protein
VTEDCLKLTVYLGERSRAHGRFAADALIGVFARHELRAGVLLRGAQGFGAHHAMRTDRLLSLSEDLPVAAVAVDERARVERALADVRALGVPGLMTLERARMLTERRAGVELPDDLHEATKLTVYAGRYERVDGRSAAQAIVAALHDAGVAGATVLLGVDGTMHGVRQRAGFLARNRRVPLMIVAVGDGGRIAPVLPRIAAMTESPLMTLERARVCRRDGVRRAAPPDVPDADESGLALWQKLMVHSREDALHDGHPVHRALMTELRRAGAAGATSLRGVWGYSGDHAPHGDRLWQLRRRTPIVTVVIDRPERIRSWFGIVEEVTAETGLVTSETVPAFRAAAGDHVTGGLRLARRFV